VSFRLRIVLAAALVLALGAPAVHASVTVHEAPKATVPAKWEPAKKLYRKFCGQCHELREARSVGIGSAKKQGPGELGGPSFDPLRIPAHLSRLAVLGTWDGHYKIMTQMTWKQITDVAKFVEVATRDHKYLAKLPSDEFLTPAGRG
jgi:mono/diheme cytochrome c family protein